jgi:hypothetical protein
VEKVNQVAQLMLICPMTASLSLFLQFCLKHGNILGWYGDLLDNVWEEKPGLRYWLKPLGACVYCYGTWVFIAFYLLYIPEFSGKTSDFISLFLGMGVNYIFIEVLAKITN